tara:strand:+ start:117 stop:917 length:801 start_codon:yes stop_codon:yes gene_type:complete
MPEGPEVKITSDFLNNHFQNEVITEILPITKYFKTKYSSVTEELKKKLIGEKINSFTIGKKTYIPLANKQYYQYHLGMTGYWSKILTKHSHYKLSSKSKELYFCDIRKFGKHLISLDSNLNWDIALYDFLKKDYDIDLHYHYLTKSISKRRNICNVLLDQKLFPGIGNYLKSEILYKSEIHPDAKWGQINKDLIYRILKNSKCLSRRSYQNGGAELKDFRNPLKKSSFNLEVYAKETDPNGNPVSSIISKDNRRTWFVPDIQKQKR